MAKNKPNTTFIKGWQLLLVAAAFQWLKTVINNQGSIDNQFPYTIALLFAVISVGFLVAAIVKGIINLAKKRRYKPALTISMSILGGLLFVLFAV